MDVEQVTENSSSTKVWRKPSKFERCQTKNMTFDVCPVDVGNLDHLTPLMEACFGEKVPDGYFDWKYLQNPAGKLRAFEAYDGEKLVGFYGVIPDLYLINGTAFPVYQAMDLMTHPDYQRKGLFSLLGQKTYDSINEEDGKIAVIGVPNYHILPGHIYKLNSKNVHSFPYVFAHRSTFVPFGLLAPSVELEPVVRANAEMDSYFLNRQGSQLKVQPAYSSAFIQWRILDNPKHDFKLRAIRKNGKLLGYCAYEMTDGNRLKIMWMDFQEYDSCGSLVRSVIKELFKATKATFIYTWEPSESKMRSAYRKAGFIKNPLKSGPFSHRVPFIVYAVDPTICGLNWFDFSQFDLQPIIQD